MKPQQINTFAVRAICPECDGAVSLFDFKDASKEFGLVRVEGQHHYGGLTYQAVIWRLLRCSGCGRAGLAKFHIAQGSVVLESFHPRAVRCAPLPEAAPDDLAKEVKEAELCASVEAWRAASALLRSALEKTLKVNGYVADGLEKKIEEAASDGVITSARRQKAHDDIRVLGNEVVHDEWRRVTEEEVALSIHYVQRVIEDFYDDRESVKRILVEKGRIKPEE